MAFTSSWSSGCSLIDRVRALLSNSLPRTIVTLGTGSKACIDNSQTAINQTHGANDSHRQSPGMPLDVLTTWDDSHDEEHVGSKGTLLL